MVCVYNGTGREDGASGRNKGEFVKYVGNYEEVWNIM